MMEKRNVTMVDIGVTWGGDFERFEGCEVDMGREIVGICGLEGATNGV